MTPRQTRACAIMILTGMGLVLLTHLVRPTLVDPPAWIGILFGVLPNFGAGLGIPFAVWILMTRLLPGKMPENRLFALSLLISLAGVSVWEFTGGTIDAFDLLATLAGSTCALLLFIFFIKQSQDRRIP